MQERALAHGVAPARWLTLSCLTLAACQEPQGSDEASSLPNVFLITVDTLRADHLGCYGYPRDTSPTLDLLAQRSVRFDQAMVQWPKTGPSLCSMLSSTYGHTSGVLRFTGKRPVPQTMEMLPEILHDAGYQTFGVVTNPSVASSLHFDQGFDVYDENYGSYFDLAKHTSRASIEALENRDPTKPFFLWVHYLDPHGKYQPPNRWLEPFVGDELYKADSRPSVPLSPFVRGETKHPRSPIGEIGHRSYLPDLIHVRDYVARYDGEIRYLDDWIGYLFEWIQGQGLLEDSIVIFTADHGESLGDHNYYFNHGRFPYDACTRVPLLLYHPELPARVVEEPVALLDLAPTLVDMLGLAPGWQFEGQSLAGALRDPGRHAIDRPVFTGSSPIERFTVAVRQGRYKLIKISDPELAEILTNEPYELYDIEADPAETVNLFRQLPEVARHLQALLDPFVDKAYATVPFPADSEAELSQEEMQRLTELGYVDGD